MNNYCNHTCQLCRNLQLEACPGVRVMSDGDPGPQQYYLYEIRIQVPISI